MSLKNLVRLACVSLLFMLAGCATTTEDTRLIADGNTIHAPFMEMNIQLADGFYLKNEEHQEGSASYVNTYGKTLTRSKSLKFVNDQGIVVDVAVETLSSSRGYYTVSSHLENDKYKHAYFFHHGHTIYVQQFHDDHYAQEGYAMTVSRHLLSAYVTFPKGKNIRIEDVITLK